MIRKIRVKFIFMLFIDNIKLAKEQDDLTSEIKKVKYLNKKFNIGNEKKIKDIKIQIVNIKLQSIRNNRKIIKSRGQFIIKYSHNKLIKDKMLKKILVNLAIMISLIFIY